MNLLKILPVALLLSVALNTNAGIIATIDDIGSHGGVETAWISPESVTIGLSGLDSHSQIDLNFDLYIMDSWDGDHSFWGTDTFGFTIAGVDESWYFNNFNTQDENNPDRTWTTGNFNSVNSWGELDRYFDDFNDGFSFAHSSDSLEITFYGEGLQVIWDESWRVTDIVIASDSDAKSTSVPEPALNGLFGAGLIGLGFTKRFRKR